MAFTTNKPKQRIRHLDARSVKAMAGGFVSLTEPDASSFDLQNYSRPPRKPTQSRERPRRQRGR